MATPDIRPALGDTLLLAEQDYMYGEGQLLLRVTRVGPSTDGWADVAGHQLGQDGAPARARGWVRVRLAAVPGARAAARAQLRSAA